VISWLSDKISSALERLQLKCFALVTLHLWDLTRPSQNSELPKDVHRFKNFDSGEKKSEEERKCGLEER
jgi:hypothetical protein